MVQLCTVDPQVHTDVCHHRVRHCLALHGFEYRPEAREPLHSALNCILVHAEHVLELATVGDQALLQELSNAGGTEESVSATLLELVVVRDGRCGEREIER